ncbi:prostate stem cell antigen isoform X1 [Mustela nigripes]|nr:prostate stem cell antigen isoform X1 [Mustela nigripes]
MPRPGGAERRQTVGRAGLSRTGPTFRQQRERTRGVVGRPEIGIYLRWGTCWLGSPSVLTVGGGASPLPGEAYKATRSPALGRPLVTMKAVLLALLAVGLALQPGSALRCYSCKAQASNHDCQHVQNCTSSETHCWTERIRVVDIVTRISKGCMSHCVDDAQNYYVGKKNITCCSTDLCNASGAHALRPAAVTLALLTTLGGLLLWGPSRL